MAATVFGLELQKLIISRGSNASALARQVVRSGHNISPQFIAMMLRGERRGHPPAINAIADALQAMPHERQILHRAAALDCGFDIGGIL